MTRGFTVMHEVALVALVLIGSESTRKILRALVRRQARLHRKREVSVRVRIRSFNLPKVSSHHGRGGKVFEYSADAHRRLILMRDGARLSPADRDRRDVA